MSIFHRVDFFHHDFIGVLMSDFRDTFILLGAPSNCEVASGVNIELKLENPYPNKRNIFSKHDDLFLQREIWKMDPLL